MDREQLKRMIDGLEQYDDSKEDTLRGMVGEFYSRKMLSTVIFVWTLGILFVCGAGYCAMRFFHADQTKDQIMYAAGFICFIEFVGILKVFVWQMIHRSSLRREIKRLELRIAELVQTSRNE